MCLSYEQTLRAGDQALRCAHLRGPKLGGRMEIDWSREWLASLLWVARVFVFTVIGFVLVACV